MRNVYKVSVVKPERKTSTRKT